MNKQKALDKILEETLNTVKAAKSFTLEQAPELAKEVVRNAKAQRIFALAICGTFLAVSVAVFFYAYNAPLDRHQSIKASAIIEMCISSVVTLFCVIVLLANVSNLIELRTAPKLYILKTLAAAVKGEK
jgi:Na+/melibiose symporter-like transporter